jgi:pilus assembly protein CpaC
MKPLNTTAPWTRRHTGAALALLLAVLLAGPSSAANGSCDSTATTPDTGLKAAPPDGRERRPAPPMPRSGAPRQSAAPIALKLAVGKSELRPFDWPVARYSVGDPCVADAMLVNPQQLYLLGKRPGSTNIILWNKQGDATILDLTVSMDTAPLQATFTQLLGKKSEAVHITAAADTLVLTGMVADVVVADQMLTLANAYLQRSSLAQGGVDGPSTAPKVVNMLSVAAPQQVMLEVKVAEVSKTLVDQLGASLGINHTNGNWTYSLLSNLLANKPSLVGGQNSRNGNSLFLDAQKRDGLVKVLAEPTIMAISGQEASFLAGGKIFIPVAQNNASGVQTITLEEKEFGVAVKFTPTVLENGRINLKVAPEVSDLNKDGVGISATGVSTTALLPSFTTRRAATTVQLYDGQSFAIGGLIKNNVTTDVKALPVLGELPILGALFRSSDFQSDRTELVFIITPRLVQPLPADYRLPTDGYIEPTRSEFFLQGKMEGTPPAQPARAPAPATPAAAGGFDLK